MNSRTVSPPGASPESAGPGRRRHQRRVLLVSFGISLAVHAFVVFLYPAVMRSLRPAVELVSARIFVRRPAGTEVVLLLERSEAAAETAPEPRRRPRPEAEREPSGPRIEREEPAAREPAPTAAERLRPIMSDPRLWRPPEEALTTLTPEERMKIRLYVRLEALNDSLAAEAEVAARATDWTITDENGNRWGVSPGQLHLGKITLPLPFGFIAPDADEQRRRDWSELERGAGAAEAHAVWKERAKAIRERKDRERTEERADTTPPDRPPPAR